MDDMGLKNSTANKATCFVFIYSELYPFHSNWPVHTCTRLFVMLFILNNLNKWHALYIYCNPILPPT